jgi:hypothetical protein
LLQIKNGISSLPHQKGGEASKHIIVTAPTGQQYHGTEPSAGQSTTMTGFILQVSLQGF